MALIPHKADPNYAEQMKQYEKDNSRWGGDHMNRGMPPKQPLHQGQQPAQQQHHTSAKR